MLQTFNSKIDIQQKEGELQTDLINDAKSTSANDVVFVEIFCRCFHARQSNRRDDRSRNSLNTMSSWNMDRPVLEISFFKVKFLVFFSTGNYRRLGAEIKAGIEVGVTGFVKSPEILDVRCFLRTTKIISRTVTKEDTDAPTTRAVGDDRCGGLTSPVSFAVMLIKGQS